MRVNGLLFDEAVVSAKPVREGIDRSGLFGKVVSANFNSKGIAVPLHNAAFVGSKEIFYLTLVKSVELSLILQIGSAGNGRIGITHINGQTAQSPKTGFHIILVIGSDELVNISPKGVSFAADVFPPVAPVVCFTPSESTHDVSRSVIIVSGCGR